MSEINTLLIIDIIVIFLGVYLLNMAIKMKKSNKVDRFVVAEEVMNLCKDEKAFAQFLSSRMMVCSVVMIVGGIAMAIHETVYDLKFGWYIVGGAVAIALLWFYKSLSDGKSKFC